MISCYFSCWGIAIKEFCQTCSEKPKKSLKNTGSRKQHRATALLQLTFSLALLSGSQNHLNICFERKRKLPFWLHFIMSVTLFFKMNICFWRFGSEGEEKSVQWKPGSGCDIWRNKTPSPTVPAHAGHLSSCQSLGALCLRCFLRAHECFQTVNRQEWKFDGR